MFILFFCAYDKCKILVISGLHCLCLAVLPVCNTWTYFIVSIVCIVLSIEY